MSMADPIPVVRHIVLVGGGHSHLTVLKNIGMRRILGVEVTLITRELDTPYSGMLPGHISGIYSRDQCHIDLVRLARFAGAEVFSALVASEREKWARVVREAGITLG